MAWKCLPYLKDYCDNCSLAGVAYITNQSLHCSERLFWLICILLSALGSYHLISQFDSDFEREAVSIVYESLPPNEQITFPAVSVCEVLNVNDIPPDVETYVESLGSGLDGSSYNYDVEEYVMFILNPSFFLQVQSRCARYRDCEKCAKCPPNGYRELQTKLGVNCTNFFAECLFSGKTFNCCQYFQPLITPLGKCFMLNSLQNNSPGSEHWLHTTVDRSSPAAVLEIYSKRSMQVSLLNQEDIPHKALRGISITLNAPKQHKTLQIFKESVVNDADVRDVSPDFRKCRFPDEVLPTSVHKSYSFSTCFADCVRAQQMQLCNCSSYTLAPDAQDGVQDCDLDGYFCLEDFSMINPDAKLFLTWSKNNIACECLPSCTEHDLRLVYESSSNYIDNGTQRSISITMPVLSTERYRRQALRTRLDVVVTIGGIMGLFMGASILSVIEFIYFFTFRLYNSLKK